MVEPTAKIVGCASVRLVAVLDQFHRQLKIVVYVREPDVCCFQPFFDRGQLPRDAFLFVGVQLGWNDPAEMSVEELLVSVLKPGLFEEQLVLRLPCLADALFRFFVKVPLDLPSERWGERDRLVVVDDFVLDEGDAYGPSSATRPAIVASAADEVLIDRAVPVLGHLHPEATAAAAAVDAALEIVVMEPHLHAR